MTEQPMVDSPKGGRKLSPLVQWSFERKFGLKKDFKMELG
jgi:hypothetical protein|tara:strand:- start:324 stop:443 length:120 start_codon:yes stop_codon:yes gene_type:complete